MTPFNPDSWMDFVLLIVIALIGLAGTVLPARMGRRHGKKLDTIKDQVQNGHTETNLRDDIDKIDAKIDDKIDKLTDLVASGFAQTNSRIEGLHEEMRTERIERIEGDRRGMHRLGLLDSDDDR